MYQDYVEASSILLGTLEMESSKVISEKGIITKLSISLREESNGTLHRIDFLQADRVMRSLKGIGPRSVKVSMETLFPRSWKILSDTWANLQK